MKCIPCMSQSMKDAILREFDVAEELKGVETCSPGILMDMCSVGGGHSGRPRSEYQLFIGKCLKEKHGQPGVITEKMRSCAVEWKNRGRQTTGRQAAPGQA